MDALRTYPTTLVPTSLIRRRSHETIDLQLIQQIFDLITLDTNLLCGTPTNKMVEHRNSPNKQSGKRYDVCAMRHDEVRG